MVDSCFSWFYHGLPHGFSVGPKGTANGTAPGWRLRSRLVLREGGQQTAVADELPQAQCLQKGWTTWVKRGFFYWKTMGSSHLVCSEWACLSLVPPCCFGMLIYIVSVSSMIFWVYDGQQCWTMEVGTARRYALYTILHLFLLQGICEYPHEKQQFHHHTIGI